MLPAYRERVETHTFATVEEAAAWLSADSPSLVLPPA
jgi:hypothetical protein